MSLDFSFYTCYTDFFRIVLLKSYSLNVKFMLEKSHISKARLSVSYHFCFYVPNIVKSILFSEQFSFFDASDNNKSN